MKITDFYKGQRITADLGGSGPSTVEIIDIDTDNYSITVEHYTNKIDVWEKQFIEYAMCSKFE